MRTCAASRQCRQPEQRKPLWIITQLLLDNLWQQRKGSGVDQHRSANRLALPRAARLRSDGSCSAPYIGSPIFFLCDLPHREKSTIQPTLLPASALRKWEERDVLATRRQCTT